MTANRERELAEVERSRHEAMRTPQESLRVSPRQLARYVDPPLDSSFALEYVFALVGDVRGLRVLDLGCGSGENSLLLARRGARVVGVDVSDSLLQLARRRLELNGAPGAAHFVVGSAHDLPVADASVDLVVGIAILHHLNLDLAAREVFRVLKPGGRAIFKEPVRDSRLLRAIRRVIPYRAPDVSPFERPLTTRELRRFASSFRTEAVRAFSLPFVNVADLVARSSAHLPKVYALDRAMLRAVPALAWMAGIRVLALSKDLSGAEMHRPPAARPAA